MIRLIAVAGFLAAVPLLCGQTPIDRAKLIGLSDAPILEKGKIARIDVSARIAVRTPGVYRLTFDLTAANGNLLTSSAKGSLETGAQTLTVPITAKAVREALAQGGPYRISNARIFFEMSNGQAEYASHLAEAGRTRAYALSDFSQELYYITDDIRAEGIEPQPSGKFGALRVRVGVFTAGGSCDLGGRLSDMNGHEIDSDNGATATLASGKGSLNLDFNGARIAKSGADGPLIVHDLRLSCGVSKAGPGGTIDDPNKRRTPPVRAADFDNPPPDFAFVIPGKPARAGSGDRAYVEVRIRRIGILEDSIEVTAASSDPRLRIEMPNQEDFCSGESACWRQGSPISFAVTAATDLPPGDYPIRVTGKWNGKEHSADVSLVIDPLLNQQKQQRADTLAALTRVEPAPASTNTATRKIHAMLILDRSGSLNGVNACDFMKAAAMRFSRQFVEGRDSFGVVSFGATSQLVVPLSDRFGDAPDRIARLRCFGGTDTGEALTLAKRELDLHADPEAVNAVVLFTDGAPLGLTANWPVRAETPCAESVNGQVKATLLPVGSGSFVFYRPGSTEEEEQQGFARKGDSCYGSPAAPPFIPETDAYGVTFTGTRPLERYASGPFAGKIRIDVSENIRNAAANQADNVMRALRTDAKNPAFVYVIALGPKDSAPFVKQLQQLVNDPQGVSFQRSQSAGLASLAGAEQEIWPAYERVYKHILDRATVRPAPTRKAR